MKTRVIQDRTAVPGEPNSSTRHPQHSRASNLVRRRPLVCFFLLTYAVTWCLWTPLVLAPDSLPGAIALALVVLGSLVPSSVAIVLIALLHGRPGVRKLLGRLLKGRIGLRWYVAVLLLPLLVPLGVGIGVVFGGNAPDVDVTILSALSLLLFSIFPGSAMGEELGWRGFALPHMQQAHSALSASLVIGAIWGCWHLPLYLVGTDFRSPSIFPAFVLAVIASSVTCTWLYNSTGGSLLIVVLYHATANLPLTLFIAPLGEHSGRPFLIVLALLVMAAGAIVVATGPAHLSRKQPKQTIVP
jgi:uncharacterized protein